MCMSIPYKSNSFIISTFSSFIIIHPASKWKNHSKQINNHSNSIKRGICVKRWLGITLTWTYTLTLLVSNPMTIGNMRSFLLFFICVFVKYNAQCMCVDKKAFYYIQKLSIRKSFLPLFRFFPSFFFYYVIEVYLYIHVWLLLTYCQYIHIINFDILHMEVSVRI